jgi:hypothetical protein
MWNSFRRANQDTPKLERGIGLVHSFSVEFGSKTRLKNFCLAFMKNKTKDNLSTLDKQQTIAVTKVLRKSYKFLSAATKQKIESLLHNSFFPEPIEIKILRNIAIEDIYLELLYQSLDRAFPRDINNFYDTWTNSIQFCFTNEKFPTFEEQYVRRVVDENVPEKPSEILRYQILANMGEEVYLKHTSEEILARLRMHFENEKEKERKTDDAFKNAIIATMGVLNEDVTSRIHAIAKEFGEEAGEFYFAFVKGKLPWALHDPAAGLRPVWDWMNLYLKGDDEWMAFFSKEFSIDELKAHRKYLIKQLSIRWKHRLSDTAKDLLGTLDEQFGESLELSNGELIKAAKLTREEFQKREKEKWLPQLRKLVSKKKARKT